MYPQRNLDTPLRRMVDDHGMTTVLKELAEIAGELHQHEGGWDLVKTAISDAGVLSGELEERREQTVNA